MTAVPCDHVKGDDTRSLSPPAESPVNTATESEDSTSSTTTTNNSETGSNDIKVRVRRSSSTGDANASGVPSDLRDKDEVFLQPEDPVSGSGSGSKGATRADDDRSDDSTPFQSEEGSDSEDGLPVETHKVYKRRFVMLFFVSFISLTNSSNLLAFTVIATQAADFWQVNIALVNALVAMGDGLSLIAAFIVPYFVDQRGLFVSSLAVNILNVIAGWLRFVGGQPSQTYFASMFIGQALSVIAMFVNAQMPPRLATLWFPANQRTIATAIQSVSWQFGLVLGIILGDQLKDHIWTMLLIQAIINTLPAVGVPFMQDQPPLPPQPSMENVEEKAERSLKEGGIIPATKRLITNFHWLFLVLFTGLPIGVMSAIITLVQQLLPEEMQSKTALFSILFFLSGIVGALVFSIIADKTKRYWILTLCILILASVSWGLFIVGIYLKEIALAIVFYAMLGLSLLGLMPVVTDFAVEVSFSSEVHLEARSTAYLWLVINSVSIILTFGTMPSVLDSHYALFVYLGILVVSTLVVGFLFHAPYRRLEEERKQSISIEMAEMNGSTQ
ncbi:solute carrier family 49 member A3 [Pelomyxa schiedti]|nr:solute carrier family 49 member A3 [Pelomyxa schiedti]